MKFHAKVYFAAAIITCLCTVALLLIEIYKLKSDVATVKEEVGGISAKLSNLQNSVYNQSLVIDYPFPGSIVGEKEEIRGHTPFISYKHLLRIIDVKTKNTVKLVGNLKISEGGAVSGLVEFTGCSSKAPKRYLLQLVAIKDKLKGSDLNRVVESGIFSKPVEVVCRQR